MPDTKKGPLTEQELMDVWRSVTDREYNRPLLENDDSNIELIEQAAAQFAKVSEQVDVNTQAMYLMPWSGQTNQPAQGGKRAEVTLVARRTKSAGFPITFIADYVKFQHRLNDYGPEGGIDVTTKRNYQVKTRVTFAPGVAGPLNIPLIAERDGYGYNHPIADQIRTPLQPGVGFENAGASVQVGSGNTHRVRTARKPETPILEHIGQYLQFITGANIGRVMLIVGVENETANTGGIFNLEATGVFAVTSVVGDWKDGDWFEQANTGAVGEFRVLSNGQFVFVRVEGVFNGTDNLTSEFGSTADVQRMEVSPMLVAEQATATWRVLDWVLDLGFEFTNPQPPAYGRSDMLDTIGRERNLPRLEGEEDDEYRKRLHAPADVVSPGAIVRTGNRVVAPFGKEVCLREVGYPKLFGVFYDGRPHTHPFAFDLDLQRIFLQSAPFEPSTPMDGERLFFTNPTTGIVTVGTAVYKWQAGTAVRIFDGIVKVSGPPVVANSVVRGEKSGYLSVAQPITTVGLKPEHRFFVMLSMLEYRGFFLLGVPRLWIDDYGFFFDVGDQNAFDTRELTNFFDGRARGTDTIYLRIYKAVRAAKAAGVRFDLYIEDYGCV